MSKLRRGQLREFSTERLFRFLTALDQDVGIVIGGEHARIPSGLGNLRISQDSRI